ncbi:MAG TPA: response regulator [Hymenobacter sp.]|nr:response regulator [Hymenobacter sp.]
MPDFTVAHLDILHVEDDPHCVELVQRALRKLPGAPAYAAFPDNDQALKFLTTQARLPRLLLLDLRLTRGSGLQLLEILRAHERTRGLPVVVFTSSQERRDVTEAYQLGANSYIIKPVEYKEFVSAIAQVVTYWFDANYQNS